MTPLSEQLKTVQEALEYWDCSDNDQEAIEAVDRLRQALSLLPAIIEGVAGMERQQQPSEQVLDAVTRAIYELDRDTDGEAPFRHLALAAIRAMPAEQDVASAVQEAIEQSYAELLLEKVQDDRLRIILSAHCFRLVKAALSAIQHPEGEK